jgi:hypothetical protein
MIDVYRRKFDSFAQWRLACQPVAPNSVEPAFRLQKRGNKLGLCRLNVHGEPVLQLAEGGIGK